MNTLRKFAVSVGLAAVTLAVNAHHSYAAFDMTKSTVVEGTVSKWEWTNPHAFLYLDAKGPDGTAQQWEFESASPAMLARSGLTRKSFKVGERISVNFHPHRTNPQFGSFVSAILPDGTKIATNESIPSAPQ